MAKFPKPIEDFANNFAAMQEKRHLADYDPSIKLTKSEVTADIAATQEVILRFLAEPIKDKRAFAAHVLFKKRPS